MKCKIFQKMELKCMGGKRIGGYKPALLGAKRQDEEINIVGNKCRELSEALVL
jgi:hypothetical protein